MVPLQPMSARVPQRTHLVAGLGRSIRRDVIGIAGAFGPEYAARTGGASLGCLCDACMGPSERSVFDPEFGVRGCLQRLCLDKPIVITILITIDLKAR